MAGISILVVEDENIVAVDIQDRLVHLGYSVSGHATSGEEAIRMAGDEPTDLVLMDIMLKGEMDGVEAAEQIRLLYDIPIIYLTAYADSKTLERAKISEPYGYILKPFEEREINTTIEMAMYRHEMGRRLKESQQWLATILKSIGDAVIATDMDGSVTFMNPVAERLTGRQQADALGKVLSEVFNIIDGNTRAPVEVFPSLIADGDFCSMEKYDYVLLAEGGKQFPVEFSASHIQDDKDRETGVVLVFRDITERRRAEAELQESELKFRSVVQSANDAIILANSKGEIIAWNSGGEKIFGHTLEEVMGKPLSIIIPPRLIELHKKGFERLANGGRAKIVGKTIELTGIKKDGTEFPLDISLASWKTKDETFFSSIIRDISERKQAEETLENTLSELNIILENANVGIAFVKDRKIFRVNRKFEEMLGFSREEIEGSSTEAFHPSPESYRELGEESQPLLEKGKNYYGERMLRHKDGTLFWCSLIGKAIDSRDLVKGTIWILSDITERKKAEEQMRAAKEEAESASRAKSEFLANMSHEIRTPLNGILGMTELALETDLTEEQREYVSIVKQSANSLLSLLNDVLDFSKIEAGKLELEQADFDLRETLHSTVETVAAQAHRKKLDLKYNISPEVPTHLVGDPGRLRQVLVNLLGNSVKFTEEGGITISVDRVSGKDGSLVLHFSVSDTGVGIPEEKQEEIFKSFTQADGSTTRKYGGTGLGLAISRQIVNMMGGDIWVESEMGKGSTFHFTAGFGLGRPSPGAQTMEVESRDLARGEPHDDLHVLLAEDNPVNQKLAASIIRKGGHMVTVVGNGIEAIEALSKKRFDVVVMDVQMPELDGLEATRIIRNATCLGDRDIPIIALTAHTMGGDRKRFLDAGMNAYVSKPFNSAELLEAIRVCAAGRREKSEEKEPPQAGQEAIDVDGALERLDGDTELLVEIWESFVEDFPRGMKAMEDALEQGDCKTLQREAHSLKSASGSIGAMALSKEALDLERAAEKEDQEDIRNIFGNLRAESGKVITALDMLLRENPFS